ncbi:ABC transporter permease [Mycolicibacterium frederiksbergense]|jgi:NitT/TauT family transport system permease protein|uniref:ABC transporter permease n=1 Tax=Mycolicibacterium frederiksbergense TaxID=117567 RepID=UPI00265BB8F5|nr:ABC transporter permease subunit [Mycolicibacterium frederiksbergense]MBX9919950.1 ABC transporter permease subunit [Mycolicibacterium frederiksbergense]MDO0977994.1 ABC transporter permease subunit [Mycolicibacterium frederiksbergense]
MTTIAGRHSATEPLRRPSRFQARAILTSQAFGAVMLGFVILAVWQVMSGVTFVIPSPANTVAVLFANLTDPAYLFDLRVTAQSVLMAFVIGTAVGGGIGLLLGLSALLRTVLEPTIIILNGIPKIVLYPVLLPIFSLSGSKVVMGVLFALFPVLINVSTGVQEIPRVYWKLAKSVRANAWQTLAHIIFPAIRRPLLTGIRLAVSLSVVGVVLSEFFATRRGLGRVVLQSYSHGEYPSMVATIMLLITISFGISIALWQWEKRLH